MDILDFFAQNPAQLQQMATTVDPAPILAQLDQVAGKQGSYGMADILNPKVAQQPMPIDPVTAALNAPLYQGSANPQPSGDPSFMPTSAVEPSPQEKAVKQIQGANRSAELAAMMNPTRVQPQGPGTPAAGKSVGNMQPIFQSKPAQAPISLAQLLGMIK